MLVLSRASGPDGRCPGRDDGEVFGVLGRWAAVDCWVAGRKLAVARELIRRRPDEENPGTATESGLPWEWDDRLAHEVALELRTSVPAARKLLQAAWALEARLPRIGQALDDGRIDLSRARMVAEETGVLLDPAALGRAEELIVAGLSRCRTWTELLRLVQRAVVAVDPDGAARRREKEERENARVSFWREAAGTCALLGTGLPTDEALQAHAHVDQRAQAYRAAGVKRPLDILRVAAYLDLLNLVPAADRIARFRTEDAAQADASPSGPGTPGSPVTSATSGAPAYPGASARPGAPAYPGASTHLGAAMRGKARARDDGATDTGFQGSPPAADAPARNTGGGDCGQDDNACGDAAAGEPPHATHDPATCNPGPSDPATRNPATRNPDGPCDPAACDPAACDRAAGRCGDPATTSPAARPQDDQGESRSGPASSPGPAVAAEVNLVLRHLDIPFLTAAGHAQRPGEARNLGPLDPALARQLAETAARHPNSKFCLTIVSAEGHAIGHGCAKPRKRPKPPRPASSHQPQEHSGSPSPTPSSSPARGFILKPNEGNGPPGGYGSWILTLPGQAREYVIDLHPVPTGECGHQYESAGHDPGTLLRHLVNVRDGKCGFPACSRHARDTDFEHAQPFEQGGRTCGCNCWSASRSCHRVKQSAGWTVQEVKPGYHQWTTPAGLTYTQEPWRYPA
ncbi:MAG TPA: DUF222 domain-containing protein [Trebonia sp.]|nr:DUF222 domain-containing protein [Trebonia sp.]